MSRAMKDSGIPWIGEIPSHWRVEQIGSCIKEVNCPNTDNAEDNALQFKMGTIISKKGGDSKYNPESLEAYNKVRQGDIIINGLNLSFDFISQRVGLVRENGVITSTYLALHPLPLIDSRYLTYLFKGYDYCKALHGMGRGLRATLGYKEFRKYSVVFPSLKEQQSIADFLDKKCSEIDEMVSLQEKIVEELKAYKQSVITEVVCRGLNPDVSMKDSGIEWIGQIPEGWEILKTLWALDMPITDGPHTTPELFDTGIPFVSAEAVSCGNGGIDFSHIRGFISQEFYEECCLKYVPQRGDVYMIKSGATTGRVSIVDTDKVFTIWSPLAVFRANPKRILPRFLFYSLQGEYYQEQVRLGWTYGTQQNIGMRTLETLQIVLPTLSEQQAIVDYLDKQCKGIDTLISLKQSKIDALKEYKKSIIYEYITGKKEVNG